jgi:hypothetical protein
MAGVVAVFDLGSAQPSRHSMTADVDHSLPSISSAFYEPTTTTDNINNLR